jgi:AraC-like DNA-binding protein
VVTDLPHLAIATEAVAPLHRRALVHELLNITWELTGLPAEPADLHWRSDIWMLGRMMVGDRTISALRKQRPAMRARVDGIDHYQILLSHDGVITGDTEDHEIAVAPGGLLVIDLAKPVRLMCTTTSHTTFLIPRDALAPLLPAGGIPHGVVVQGAAATVLGQYLQALVKSLPQITRAQAPYLETATYNLLAACLAAPGAGADHRLELIRPVAASHLRQTIQRMVDARLHDRALTPDAIANAAGLSRSALYRVMQAEGGVAAFVLASRIARARQLLTAPGTPLRIAAIAAACGFSSEAQFSHCFRRETGMTPSEARRLGTACKSPAPAAAETDAARQIREWMFGAGG